MPKVKSCRSGLLKQWVSKSFDFTTGGKVVLPDIIKPISRGKINFLLVKFGLHFSLCLLMAYFEVFPEYFIAFNCKVVCTL